MSQIKRKIYKIRLQNLKEKNTVRNNLHHFEKEIFIVSSPKFMNKVKEDLCLQECFINNKVNCKIISYEDNISSKNCLIRSVWGYHNQQDVFTSFIRRNHTINTSEIILHNMDKKKQYELLEKYSIPRIETKFLKQISEVEKIPTTLVIKPVVSASGDNTYIVKDEDDLKNIGELSNIMVQPYIENIKNGETSVIVINHEIQYGIIRHPGIFTKYEKEKYLSKDELDSDLISLVQKVLQIKEYQNAVFMRIDCVKDKEYKIMELELVDPDLFVETIPNKNERDQIYQKLVSTVKKEL